MNLWELSNQKRKGYRICKKTIKTKTRIRKTTIKAITVATTRSKATIKSRTKRKTITPEKKRILDIGDPLLLFVSQWTYPA